MEIEKLKMSHVKRNIMIGVIAVLIISAIVLNFTRAKYRVTDSIEIVNGTVNYTPYDFKVIAMYQEQDGEYVEIESMPSSGYAINEEMSYCTLDNVNKDSEAILYTDDREQHVIGGLKKNSKCYLYFDKIYTIKEILSEYNIDQRNNINAIYTSSTTKTVFETKDWKGTTYYFAGAPTDNWVSFAGFYWRIIRINGDGSIRMIYNGTSTATTGNNTMINNGALITFNNQDRSEYVGLKYTIEEQHGQLTNSPILDVLNDWYITSSLFNYNNFIDETVGFCSDREMADGYTWQSQPTSFIYYKSYDRLYLHSLPSLLCNNNNDILKIPIGLITADEIMFAGGYVNENGYVTNRSYYLYNNANYWSMTPFYYIASANSAGLFYVNSSGGLSYWRIMNNGGVRPVINLSSDVSLLGSGTSTDPYTVLGA